MMLPLTLRNRCRPSNPCMRSTPHCWSRCRHRKRGRLLHLWWQCRACNSCMLLHATKGQFDRKGIVSTCNYYSKSRSRASKQSKKLHRLQNRFRASNQCRTYLRYNTNLCSTENTCFHQRRVCLRGKQCKWLLHFVLPDSFRRCIARQSNRNNTEVEQGRQEWLETT